MNVGTKDISLPLRRLPRSHMELCAKKWSHGPLSLLLWLGEKSLIGWQYAQLKIRDYITKKGGRVDILGIGGGAVQTKLRQEFRDPESFKAKRYQCFLNSICLKRRY